MVLIIQEPRAHPPAGQEIVPFDDLVEFGDGEKNVAFLIKKTYEKKAHRGKANLIQAPEKFGKAIRMQAELFPADPPSEPFELTAGAGQVDLAHVLALVVLEVSSGVVSSATRALACSSNRRGRP